MLLHSTDCRVRDLMLGVYLRKSDCSRKVIEHRSIVVDITENDSYFQTWVRDTMVNTICCMNIQRQGLIIWG